MLNFARDTTKHKKNFKIVFKKEKNIINKNQKTSVNNLYDQRLFFRLTH